MIKTDDNMEDTTAEFQLERFIHSIKTAIACLIGYGITKLTVLDLGQWLLITIAVVMCGQINVGSVMNKATLRFLGTLSGSILAALTLALFGPNPLAIYIMIGFSALIFSYAATSSSRFRDAGTLGTVTVIIILINPHPTIHVATHRFFEISVGILIAALFAQFVFPIHARDHLRRMQAKTLFQMRDYYHTSLMIDMTPKAIETYQDLDEKIAASLAEQRALAKQSSGEPFGGHFNTQQFGKILHSEKEIFRSQICMRYACDMLPTGRRALSNLPDVKQFHQHVYQALGDIAAAIQAQEFKEINVTIPTTTALKEAIQAVNKTMQDDAIIYSNGFLFCAEILVNQLQRLIDLFQESTT